MSRRFVAAAGLLFGTAMLLAPCPVAAETPAGPPQVSASERGATIEDVTIKTYGVTKPSVVRRYLSLHEGSILEQSGVDRDYDNLLRLGGYRPRATIEPGASPHGVKLHWIVMAKWLKPTDHPFYADQPLSAPIQGVGFIVTAQSLDSRGTNISAYTQLSRRANLARVLFTIPTRVDPDSGRDRQVILDAFGGRGVFRASQPLAINIYSWTSGFEAVYLARGGDGTEFEIGARQQHSSTAESSGIVAPSLYDTYYAPARNTVLEAGLSHPCLVSPVKWHPPYCSVQYRLEVLDGIGTFDSTSTYQEYIGDVGNYTSIGTSTLVLHASAARTGGVLPQSFFVCATLRGYPKSFCGTDAESVTAEFRIADVGAQKHDLRFVVFTETGASRIRGGTQAFAPPNFQWHPDSGIGVIYRLLRVDLAYGQQGGRLTFELVGQTY
jgi:hypothetical protein